MCLGQELKRAWELARETGDEAVRGADGPGAIHHRDRADRAWERAKAIEAMVCEMQAQSVDGALVQVVLASSDVSDLSELADVDVAAFCLRMQKLLFSIRTALEAHTGRTVDELTFGDLMPDYLNPHLDPAPFQNAA